MSEDKFEGPESLEARKKKKVALVDIDGCLLINGKLNLDLVKLLREGDYDEIILFTQRSKFVQSLNIPNQIMAGNELKTTEDAVTHLSEALGRPVKVSTSVDFMLVKPLAYFDELKPVEDLILENARNMAKLRSHQANLQQIEQLGRELATAQKSEVSKLKQEISVIKQRLLSEKELEEIERKKATLEQEIKKEKLAIVDYQKKHPEYKTTDPEGYPVNKEHQLRDLRKELTQDGVEVEEDYFDDNYLNLQEFDELDDKPNRFVVSKGKILPFEEVAPNLDAINDEIAKLRAECEKVIEDLNMNVATVITMSYKQRNELGEPQKTAVINLQQLNDIQELIKTQSQESLGAGLQTAEFLMSKKSSAQNIPQIKEGLEKIRSLKPFLDNLGKTKAELSSLKTEYENVINDKLGIKVSTAHEMSAKQIQELREPHKTAVTNLHELIKIQEMLETEGDAAKFFMSKQSTYQNIPVIKEELEKIKTLEPFLDKLNKTKVELSSLKTEYERIIEDKLGIKVSTAQEMSAEQIQELREPHKTAVTHLQELTKMQAMNENDAAEHMSKRSCPNVQELKESLKAIYIKTIYSPADLENPRDHQYEVTTDTVKNTSVEFKQKYQDAKGDALKTRILSDFKSKIEEFSSEQDIKKYLKEYKKSDAYKTLAAGQGEFTRIAHKVGLEKWITTSSVKAINQIVKDAVKKIEEQQAPRPTT
ncbi:hypothetical protein [Legionella sp. WA2022007384]